MPPTCDKFHKPLEGIFHSLQWLTDKKKIINVYKLVLLSQTRDYIYLKGGLLLKELYEKSMYLLPFHTYGSISIIERQARYFVSNLKKKRKGRKSPPTQYAKCSH